MSAAPIAYIRSFRHYTCYACAIMRDHVHLLIRKQRDKAEVMIQQFQDARRAALNEAKRRAADHSVWGGPGWKAFLETRNDMERVVEYIWNNPMKAGRPPQRWEFVTQYDG